jgi:hypothetical protein
MMHFEANVTEGRFAVLSPSFDMDLSVSVDMRSAVRVTNPHLMDIITDGENIILTASEF